jgi:hypothetical protein
MPETFALLQFLIVLGGLGITLVLLLRHLKCGWPVVLTSLSVV